MTKAVQPRFDDLAAPTSIADPVKSPGGSASDDRWKAYAEACVREGETAAEYRTYDVAADRYKRAAYAYTILQKREERRASPKGRRWVR